MNEIEQSDKQEFLEQFAALRPDLYFPADWTEGQKDQAVETLRKQNTKVTMFASIPMICRGESCVYSNTCPLLAKNLHPYGKKCPIEMAMVQQFFHDYVEELHVDTSLMVEVSMVRDLVDQEIQYLRKVNALAEDHFITENVVGLDEDGKPILKKELHQAVEYEDRIHKRKEKLRSALLATREARAKVGQVQLDTAQAISGMIADIKKAEREEARALKAKLGLDMQDEYIDAEVIADEVE